MPGTCEFVILQGKGGFTDVIKSKILTWQYPGLTVVGPQSSLFKKRQKTQG